ncbi:hypothetical protein B4U79_19000, partial [Dinothrombium tinctorium]
IATDALNKQLKRQFCVDSSSLNITRFRTESDLRRYAFFELDNVCYKAIVAYIDEKSILPNVTSIHKCSAYERSKDSRESIWEYYFDARLQVYLLKRTVNSWKLINFNQVWIGCAQPICLIGDIDAAVSRDSQSQNFFIFRGMYYWELTEAQMTPSSSRAIKIEKAPGFFDCGFFSQEDIILIRGNEKYVYTKDLKQIANLPVEYEEFKHCDAGITLKLEKVILKENKAYIMPHFQSKIREFDLGEKLANSDAALVWREQFYIFKRHFIFASKNWEKFNEKDFSAPKNVLKHFFNCEATIKNSFGSIENLERQILDHKEGVDPDEWSEGRIDEKGSRQYKRRGGSKNLNEDKGKSRLERRLSSSRVSSTEPDEWSKRKSRKKESTTKSSELLSSSKMKSKLSNTFDSENEDRKRSGVEKITLEG